MLARISHSIGDNSTEDIMSQTTAQQIAHRYDDDGQRWTDSDGIDLHDALEAAGGRTSQRDEFAQRWRFPDGSAIITTDGAWDLGIPGTDTDDRRDCVCWSEDGETCRYPHECECPCHAD
jgi:hypothetical protein